MNDEIKKDLTSVSESESILQTNKQTNKQRCIVSLSNQARLKMNFGN